jgi:hypothetical protein
MDRGTGRTTKLILSAPKNSLFIWCNGHLSYPKSLAKNLERDDLEIVSPGFLMSDKWRGRIFSGIVIDHDFWEHKKYFDQGLYDIINYLGTRIRA